MYKLSIITINKNNRKGLEKTCLSVVSQTYKSFEWIIIDGASEDGSVNIIQEHIAKVNYWVSEPDSGVYNAMNKGIKRANGEYLLFLNSGDFLLHPWTLQEFIAEIAVCEYADVYFCDGLGSDYSLIKSPSKITFDFLLNKTINHQNSYTSRKLFDNELYDENYHIVSDWLFFIVNLIKRNIVFYRLEVKTSVYSLGGISSTQQEKFLAERKHALTALYQAGYISNAQWKKAVSKIEYELASLKKSGIKFILLLLYKIAKHLLPLGVYKLLKRLKKQT